MTTPVTNTTWKIEAIADKTTTVDPNTKIYNAGDKFWCLGTQPAGTASKKVYYRETRLSPQIFWAPANQFKSCEESNDGGHWDDVACTGTDVPSGDHDSWVATHWKGGSNPLPNTGGSGGSPQPSLNPFQGQGTYKVVGDHDYNDDDQQKKDSVKDATWVEIVGWYGDDHVIMRIGGALYWGEAAWFEAPSKQPKHTVAAFPQAPPAKLNIKGVVLPAPASDNWFVAVGESLWGVCEFIGRAAWGMDKAILDAIVMPQLRMYREPENWTYRVRHRPAVTVTAPTADAFGSYGDGEIEGGAGGHIIASTGSAGASAAFSTLAFFSWPFRKWAGPQYIEDKNPDGTNNAYLHPSSSQNLAPPPADWK